MSTSLDLSPASFDAQEVYISVHALERYVERRNTTAKAAEFGIRRLLGRAALQPLPPLKHSNQHGWSRRFLVGEFVFIMDEQCSTLITMWRQTKHRRGQR